MIKIKIKEIVSPSTLRAMNPRNIQKSITVSLKEIGEKLVKTAKDGIKTSPKTYKRYFYPGIGYVRSSRPGTYPADQSGSLRRSVATRTEGYRMYFGAKKDYAKYLQQTNSPEKLSTWIRIAPRPFLTLAHNQNAPQFGDIMEENINKLTK